MNSLALVINSHSSNQDCLELFFIQLEKYFEEQTFSNVYLFVDKIAEDFNLPTYVTIVPYEEEESFTDQMIQCLSVIDENVIIGAQVGIAGHLKVASGVTLSARTGVTKDINNAELMGGFPALPIKEFRKQKATLSLITKQFKQKKK